MQSWDGVNTPETQVNASDSITPDGSYKADQTPIETENNIENMGLAVFIGDKLIGELNNIESLCHMMVSNQLKNATITIQNPYDYSSKISMHISIEKTPDIDVKLVNGYPYITCEMWINRVCS